MSKFVLPMIDLTKMGNFTYVYKLLIIDKDPQNLATVESALTMKSYRIHHAPDTTTAKRIMEEWKPDLILLDLSNPGKENFSFLEELQRDQTSRTIPVIGCLTMETRQEAGKILQAGATDFLLKPFLKEEISNRIQWHKERKEQDVYIRELHDRIEKKDINYSAVSRQLRSSIHSIRLMNTSLLHTLGKDRIEEDEYQMLLGIYNETTEASLVWDNFQKSNMFNPERCKPQKQRVDINSILCNIANAYLPIAQQKNITLFKEGFDTELLAEVDIEMFRSIIRNLLSEAIRNNRPGGEVILSSYGSPEDEYLIKIQRPSLKEENGEKKGNGWQLCSSYAEAHNGKIWFEGAGQLSASYCFSFTG